MSLGSRIETELSLQVDRDREDVASIVRKRGVDGSCTGTDGALRITGDAVAGAVSPPEV